MHWIYGWGLDYGIYVWISTLVIGDLMGSRFWVGCGFFSWGDGGGEEEASGHVLMSRFSQDYARFQTAPFFMLYIIY